MPVVAQVAGAVAVTALIMGPWWTRVATVPASAPLYVVPPPAAVAPNSPASPASPESPDTRPAHLNLDVRHTFANVDVIVTVDGKKVLDTSLEGSSKKFKMFGRRTERSFARTLDLEPGVRLVRVNIKSDADHFDQTRVERFELTSASVASLQITADKSAGLAAIAERPAVAKSAPVPAYMPAVLSATPAPPAQPASAPAHPQAADSAATATQRSAAQQADALTALLQSLRSILIAIAGFVATTSAGFVLEQFLSAKKRAYAESRRMSATDVIQAP